MTIRQGIPDLTSLVDARLREVGPLLPDLAPLGIDARERRLNV